VTFLFILGYENNVLQIKVNLLFINSNYLTEIVQNTESFQHDNVFATLPERKRFFMKFICIILTFEVDYKQKQNAKLT